MKISVADRLGTSNDKIHSDLTGTLSPRRKETDMAKIDAIGIKSIDEGILSISSLAEGYAREHIPTLWNKLRSDLRRAGFDILPMPVKK